MEKNNGEKKNSGSYLKDYAPFLGSGIQLAITVAALAFLGIWLDEKFNSSPWFTIGCSFFGVFAGLYNFIKAAIKSGK
ncbi:MAG TPA: AtpZ/AtpI family protein [Ignavibacteriaceae bacterium]|jgi:F0F1-type ATP synthase assembly protein I|nr:AtpZ/AtpI family protein [Ignavibacteriaceae bacterium]